jgi:hypothetical protein
MGMGQQQSPTADEDDSNCAATSDGAPAGGSTPGAPSPTLSGTFASVNDELKPGWRRRRLVIAAAALVATAGLSLTLMLSGDPDTQASKPPLPSMMNHAATADDTADAAPDDQAPASPTPTRMTAAGSVVRMGTSRSAATASSTASSMPTIQYAPKKRTPSHRPRKPIRKKKLDRSDYGF